MTTIIGIITFMSRKHFMLGLVEHEKRFITSRPGYSTILLVKLSCKCDSYPSTTFFEIKGGTGSLNLEFKLFCVWNIFVCKKTSNK